MPFVLGILALIGLDLYMSVVRMRDYGPRVELNPVARQLCADHGPVVAAGFLALWNLGLLGALLYYRCNICLHVLFGFKLGIGLMQLKSLELESFVEKLLRKAKEKQNVTQQSH